MTRDYGKEYFEGRASNYWWTIGNYQNIRNAPHWQEMLKILRMSKANGKLLDIGCAYGFLVHTASSNFESYGVDISTFAIKKSKEFGDGNILMASAVNLPFRGASFDIITVIDALEHVVELAECLNEIERTLKKDGVLLLQLPNPLVWKYVFGALGLRDKSHVNNFWLKEWKKVLSERKMRIHKCYGIVSFVFRKLKFLLKSKMFPTLYPEWWVIAKK